MKRNFDIWMFVTIIFSLLLFHSSSVIPVKANCFDLGADPLLVEHSKNFKPRIYNVTDRVHVAVGYSLGNMIIVDGVDGLIIIDTTEDQRTAVKIYRKFRRRYNNTKPLKAIILTHFHADHIKGANRLIRESNQTNVRVIVHSTLLSEQNRFLFLRGAATARAFRQLGAYLNKSSGLINSGLGPFYKLSSRLENIFPTETFDISMSVQIAGLNFELFHTPGETDDQITVWLPDLKVVMPADNIYKAFPNLYAIRGSPPRDIQQWYKSLDFVRELGAEFMVPSHTKPLFGKKLIFDTITTYRDGIQYVHDQTVRQMMKAKDIDEIASEFKLPNKLATHPYLLEFYGTVEWSVRGVYNIYTGWFDGDPVNLFPLNKIEKAKRWSELLTKKTSIISGVDTMFEEANKSLKKSKTNYMNTKMQLVTELKWALELASHGYNACDKCEKGKKVMIEALRLIGSAMRSANARNYFLSYAFELEKGIKTVYRKPLILRELRIMDLNVMLDFLCFKFKAEDCNEDEKISFLLNITDKQSIHLFQIRNCIIQHNQNPTKISYPLDAEITTTYHVLLDVLTERKSSQDAIRRGEFLVKGNNNSFQSFMDHIEWE